MNRSQERLFCRISSAKAKAKKVIDAPFAETQLPSLVVIYEMLCSCINGAENMLNELD